MWGIGFGRTPFGVAGWVSASGGPILAFGCHMGLGTWAMTFSQDAFQIC